MKMKKFYPWSGKGRNGAALVEVQGGYVMHFCPLLNPNSNRKTR